MSVSRDYISYVQLDRLQNNFADVDCVVRILYGSNFMVLMVVKQWTVFLGIIDMISFLTTVRVIFGVSPCV